MTYWHQQTNNCKNYNKGSYTTHKCICNIILINVVIQRTPNLFHAVKFFLSL